MTGKWIIYGNHIAIECGNEILHPDAHEIYRELSGDDILGDEGIELEPLQRRFPTLYFSEIGSPIKCIFDVNKSGEFQINFCCNRRNKEINIDVIDGKIIDQCLSEDEWFYVTGDTEALETILNNVNIKTNGDITVSQYIGFIRSSGNLSDGTVVNKINENFSNKPIDMEKSLPEGLQADLYAYQKTGYLWMKYMLSENKGCILGDEMGLGKTLQIITLALDYIHSGKGPILVIAPVTLLENWKNECAKFAPMLKTHIHHGPNRTGRYIELQCYDIVIISYNTAGSDLSILNMIDWGIVVIDEAQNIKNPGSNRAQFVKRIKRKAGIAVTGTPFENHVTDIWSIVDFVSPGLFGTLQEYRSYISDDINGAGRVEPLLTPIMIRRKVSEVARDLPERVIIPQPMAMSPAEAAEYEGYRIAAGYSAETGSIGLEVLQTLRMYCTHPMICNNDMCSNPAKVSVKYQHLCEILEEIFDSKEKVLLFTSYQKMFDIIDRDIPNRFGVPVMKINGSTPVEKRQSIVDEFNTLNESALLVLNPRAAGNGLNITSANHVIHYNLEWNPALEDQASARAYRRGQQKTVFIYRLFYIDTVEQIINERIERKREIADIAVAGVDGSIQNKNDIIAALRISPMEVKENDKN